MAEARIYLEIADERRRQNEKWGEQHHSLPYWTAILMEELGEASASNNSAEYRKEIIQTAAVGVQILEALDRSDYPPVEESIFLHLNNLIRDTGFLARAILDSRKGTKTGKATPADALHWLDEARIHAHGLRRALLVEEEEAIMGAKT